MLNPLTNTSFVNVAKSWIKKLTLLFFIWLFSWIGLTAPVKQKLSSWLEPIVIFNNQLLQQLIIPFNNLQRSYRAARKVQNLEYKLAHAQAQLSQLDQLKKENQALKKLVENTDRGLVETHISRPILSLSQPAVVLPKDSEISLPIAVLVEQTLVGISSQKKEGIAYIDLLWQKSVSPVLAQTEEGVEGLIKGDGRRVLLTEIPMEEEVTVGSRVVTTGQAGIAADLYIGQVRSIESGPSSAVKQAVVEQYVSFYESSLVELR